MAGLNDFPELKKMFDALEVERDKILAAQKPTQDKYDALRAEEDAIRVKIMPLKDELAKTRPRLAEIANQLSAIARGAGGRSMSQAPDTPPPPEAPPAPPAGG